MIYTIDNPKLVKDYSYFKGRETFTGVVKDESNHIVYYLNGLFHREDGPACEYADGTRQWWLNGKCHRTDGPAIEWAGGDKGWFLNGKCHRTDGPAYEYVWGDKSWWLHGKRYGFNDDYTNESWKRFVIIQLLK